MILAVGYDKATKVLEVVFTSGAVWHYREVPPKVYKELMAADSKGSYMGSCVIGVFPEERIRRRQ